MPQPQRSKKDLGAFGEDIAARHLQTLGYEIVARNWRCEAGEIDIVAREGGEIAFVEVKTRRYMQVGEAIDARKREKLVELGYAYDLEHDLDGGWRIDAALVSWDAGRQSWKVDVIKSAVMEE